MAKFGDLAAAIRTPFQGNPSLPGAGAANVVANTANAAAGAIPQEWAVANGFEHRAMNAAGTDYLHVHQTNASNQVMMWEQLAQHNLKKVTWQVQDNGSLKSQGFFLVNPGEQYRVASISYIHTTQASVAATVGVEKTSSGTAVGSGVSLLSATFNAHTIANNTVTAGALTTTNAVAGVTSDNKDLILNPGDQLSVVISATPTSLAGVCITVVLVPLGLSCKTVTYYMNANADLVQGQSFFIANRAWGNILNVSMRWQTLSSVSGLKLTVTKDTSTTAPGGGTSILTDNTNAGPLVTQTANTTYVGTMSATAATIRMAAGDRLAIEFSGGTLTALTGLVVTVSIAETFGDDTELQWFLDHVPGQTTLVGIAAIPFFIADRDYEVTDFRYIDKTAGTDGGAVTVGVGVATGTTAAASATISTLQTDNTNAGFNGKGTANTTQVATLAALGGRYLLAGDRLCVVPAGTFTTAAGNAITMRLTAK